MRERLPIALCAGLLLLFLQVTACAQTAALPPVAPLRIVRVDPELELSLALVIDPDFAPISDEDVARMTATAAAMLKDKFALTSLRVRPVARLSIGEFFAKNLDPQGAVYKAKDARRYKLGAPNDFAARLADIKSYLGRWAIPELQAFFPEPERAALGDYEALSRAVATQMDAKITAIAAMRAEGKPLLGPESGAYRSFLNWLVALENQRDYDLVITNTFIVYDDMSQPAPHSVFGSCKVGGVSHANPYRQALGGRVVMGSTFGLDTALKPFMEADAPTPRLRRDDIIGAYILAHEIGHALFKLPDHYDHGPDCLMNNQRDVNYAQGYELLLAHPGPCARCAAWLSARRLYWEGRQALFQKDYARALAALGQVPKLTPSNVDGHYARYMGEVAFLMARAALGQNDIAKARSFARTALRLDPGNGDYEAFLAALPAP